MRARMRELARRRMLAAVPQADLVVMNPTHYAVALRTTRRPWPRRAWWPRAPTCWR
jgi:flagellar biosynthesis protein FlhB